MAGRPTAYTPELLKKAGTYLASYKKEGDVIPSIEGFAMFLGISRQTVYEWSRQDDKGEFSDIYEAILAEQGKKLVNMGLTGDFAPTITKLMLTKHGYSDRQEITGKDGEPLIPEKRKEIEDALDAL